MRKFILAGTFLHLFLSVGFSQANRKTVIENKIKAITQVEYKESGDKKKETKTYYTVRGDDSIKIINGETIFSYRTILDKGRTVELERENPAGLVDEIRIYKYNADSSYSIEIMEYEEKKTRYEEFNSKHDCLLTVLSNSDTTLYKYNALGKLERLILLKNNKNTQINIVEIDSNGDVIRAEYKTEGVLWGFSVYKYNDKGLQEECTIFAIDNKVEKLMSKTELKYEFYYP